jgi:beta-galactosidase
VFVSTPQITDEAALVQVQTTVDNSTLNATHVQVSTEVFELDWTGHITGQPTASTPLIETPRPIEPGQSGLLMQFLKVPWPKLWSIKSPQCYTAVTTIRSGERIEDSIETPFGIRTFAFTADRGFLLNGERLQIQGVCLHHDLGALGSAINKRALERQLEILKEMGANAIRTSHNPAAPELLELCDRMGFLVMDEGFDCWLHAKRPNDYHLLFPDWHEKDLRALVRRDRNHPSVVLWSIGNEIPEQGTSEGWQMASHLAGIVREEDRTRPVTAGCNSSRANTNGFQLALDVSGFNYQPKGYVAFRTIAPLQPIVATETASCISSRGEYFFPIRDDNDQKRTVKDIADFQVSGYDFSAWTYNPQVEFRGLDEAPFVAGEFVWTGFDYLGEPEPYSKDSAEPPAFTDSILREKALKELKELGKIRVPARSSYFGIVDLAGFKKDRFYLYQSHWRPDFPLAHILPHWNWPERVGFVTPVHVYTSGDEAELFLNGKSLGRKKRGPFEYRLRWDDVKYEPGELNVVAYLHGKRWAEDVVKTAGPASRLILKADRATIKADGQDLSFITVTIADKDRLLVPRSKNRVSFEISGPGEIVATDNGDATSLESFQATERAAYNGLVLVIVRTKPGVSGAITLRAKSNGLAGAEITISSRE